MRFEFSSTPEAGAGTFKAIARYALIPLLFPALVLAGGQKPVDVIRGATDRVFSELNAEPGIREDRIRLNRVIQEHIVPHVDLVALSRLTLGKYWQRASDEQRAAFAREFSTLLIKTYSAALTEYTHQKIDYLSSEVSADGRKGKVRTRVTVDGRAPVAVEYSLRQLEGTWKIYDLRIEGVSLAINYRSSFAQDIRKHGLDGLIERLTARNATVDAEITAAQTAAAYPR
jgi:phospholipid transport system substrate-binding protein